MDTPERRHWTRHQYRPLRGIIPVRWMSDDDLWTHEGDLQARLRHGVRKEEMRRLDERYRAVVGELIRRDTIPPRDVMAVSSPASGEAVLSGSPDAERRTHGSGRRTWPKNLVPRRWWPADMTRPSGQQRERQRRNDRRRAAKQAARTAATAAARQAKKQTSTPDGGTA